MIIVFLSCLSLFTCFIRIEEIKKIYAPQKDIIASESSKQICHTIISNTYANDDIDEIFNVHQVEDWTKSKDLFLLYSTRNDRNSTNYHKSYTNSFIEIMQNKNCNDGSVFLIREIINKIVEKYAPCLEEFDFLFQTHFYVMIDNLLDNTFIKTKPYKTILYRTIISNLFFLAERFKLNLVINLILICDSQNKLSQSLLSVIRKSEEPRKKVLYDNQVTRKHLENENKFWTNDTLFKIISDYKIDRCKENIVFFIQENSKDDAYFDLVQNFNKKRESIENLRNDTFYVLISEKEILDTVKEINKILTNLEIKDVNDYASVFKDDNFQFSRLGVQKNMNNSQINGINENHEFMNNS